MNIEQESFQTWDKLSEIYWSKFSELRIYDHTYYTFLENLPKAQASILDLCCGPGIISHFLLAHNQQLKITGLDVSPNMILKAGQMIPGFSGHVMKIQDLGSLKQSFDGIICGFGFPYLNREEVKKCIKDSYKKLSTNGVFYTSYVEGPEIEPEIKSGPNGSRTFFYYHNTEIVNSNLKEYGFSLLQTWKIPYPSENSNQQHMVLLCRKT